MSLDVEKAVSQYLSMSGAAKVYLLGRLCFDLTIGFRDIALEPTVTQSGLDKLQGINEIQHKLLSQLLAHQSDRIERYPDRVFLLLLLEMADKHKLARLLQHSLLRELQKAQ